MLLDNTYEQLSVIFHPPIVLTGERPVGWGFTISSILHIACKQTMSYTWVVNKAMVVVVVMAVCLCL